MAQDQNACTLCGKIPDTPCHQKTIEELVVTDYKSKFALHVGFPFGERHTVQGWKIKHHRTVFTDVCDPCADEHFAAIKRHAPRNTKIAGGVSLVLLILMIILLVLEGDNKNYGGIGLLLMALLATSVVFFFFYLNRVLSGKEYSFNALHPRALKKLLGQSPTMWLGNEYPKSKDTHFFMETKNWATLGPQMAEMETKTGWSHFHYLRDFSPGGQQVLTPEQGAESKKVAHLGIYLEKPEDE